MTKIRAAALSCLLVATGLGTILDSRRPPASLNRSQDGFLVLSGDFHVHAFIGDGAVPPWQLPLEAARRGLDVIAITNHNQTLAARIAVALARPERGALVLEGQEITAPRYHMIAAGITGTVNWRLSAADAAREVHRQGGVAIAAHPVPTSWLADNDAIRELDGAEAAHPLIEMDSSAFEKLQAFFREARTRNGDVAPIGSTDFHFAGPIGKCRTYIFAKGRSKAGVIEAITAGRTVAADMQGHLTGDPQLVAEVRRLFPIRDFTRQPDRWSPLTAALAMAGLFVLVLFR